MHSVAQLSDSEYVNSGDVETVQKQRRREKVKMHHIKQAALYWTAFAVCFVNQQMVHLI